MKQEIYKLTVKHLNARKRIFTETGNVTINSRKAELEFWKKRIKSDRDSYEMSAGSNLSATMILSEDKEREHKHIKSIEKWIENREKQVAEIDSILAYLESEQVNNM